MEWIIIVVAIILIIAAFFLGKKLAVKPIQENNEKVLKEREKIKQDIFNLNEHKDDLINRNDELIAEYNNYKKIMKDAHEKAKNAYKNEVDNADKRLKEFQEWVQEEKEKEQQALDSLKKQREATIRAFQREENIKRKQEDYCLRLPHKEKFDIQILEDVKNKISKPRAVAMIEWSNYYQLVAKTLFPKILGANDVCGLYKITNQKTGECYIGQARDIRKRWYEHCKAACGVDTPQGNKLYKAMQKDGIENFSFELLEICDSNELNKKERYYIDLYQSNIVGYNSQKGNK